MVGTVNITLEGIDNLRKAFEISSCIWSKYAGYRIIDDGKHYPKMLLYWTNPTSLSNPMKDVNFFPYEMDSNEITNFVYGWLKRVDYGDAPDTDGSVEKGFQFECSNFFVDDKLDYTYVGAIVSPIWMVYDK